MQIPNAFSKFETIHEPKRPSDPLSEPSTLDPWTQRNELSKRRAKRRVDPETTLLVLILAVSTLLFVIGAGFVKELL